MPEPIVLVQLSDPHVVEPGRRLLGRIDTPALLAQAIAAVQALPVPAGAVVLTGDLVERGRASEYEHLRQLLAPLSCPVHLMPGNHDHIPTLRAVFADRPLLQAVATHALAVHVLYAVDLGGLRLVALDTVVPGAPHGQLCAARLDWLEQTLAAEPAVPTVVAVHHPPFATGIAHMDDMGLLMGADGLAAVLRRHPQVERLICGHLHRSIQCRFGGTLAMTAPSTAHQIVLDLRPQGPPAWTLEPPGLVLHLWTGQTLVSHVHPCGDHGPPQLY